MAELASDVPLDLLEHARSGVASSGNVALRLAGVGRSLSVAGSLLGLVGAGSDQAVREEERTRQSLLRDMRASRDSDSLRDGVKGVGSEVAGLGDDSAESVRAFSAV